MESVHCNTHSVFRVHVILTNMLTTHLRVLRNVPERVLRHNSCVPERIVFKHTFITVNTYTPT